MNLHLSWHLNEIIHIPSGYQKTVRELKNQLNNMEQEYFVRDKLEHEFERMARLESYHCNHQVNESGLVNDAIMNKRKREVVEYCNYHLQMQFQNHKNR